MLDRERCEDCKWNYPSDYLSRMFTNGGYTEPICGICALERLNIITRVRRDKFRGELAEANRLNAISWRKSHPKEEPNG